MFSLASLERELKRDEGYRARPYIDSVGVATLGYGRTHYSDGESVHLSDAPTTKSQAAEWLRADAYAAIMLCQDIYADYDEMPSNIQNVLANMAFNLGNRLRQFKRMNKAVARGDKRGMIREMKDSRWYSQVGIRATRLIEKI